MPLFDDFIASEDSLRVYDEDQLIFQSGKDRLQPLLDYIADFTLYPGKTIIFDRITGNAAALLAIKAGCQEVYSPLGSELAARTLSSHHIEYYFTEVVPYIQKADQQGMCPMEKLSIGKNPEEFYQALQQNARPA